MPISKDDNSTIFEKKMTMTYEYRLEEVPVESIAEIKKKKDEQKKKEEKAWAKQDQKKPSEPAEPSQST